MDLRCMPCFIKQYTREMEGSSLDKDQKEVIVREMLSLLSTMDYSQAPVDVSLLMHDRMKKLGVSDDPYKDLKSLSTMKALEHVKEIEKEVEGSEDPIFEAVLASLAGNVIDYGAKNELDLHEVLERARTKGFSLNDHGLFRDKLRSAREVVIFLDNSGEVVFDHLLMRTIHREYPGIRFKAVVKKVPLLNDVTLQDSIDAGIKEEYIELVELPNEGWIKPEQLSNFPQADIFLSKGQGNFESLSDASGVFFLLVTKCDVVAEYLGVEVGEAVFKYIENEK
ncbi:MAG: damage-control phosphatase ARMT1 family protein [Thermoplasmatota archaeon]